MTVLRDRFVGAPSIQGVLKGWVQITSLSLMLLAMPAVAAPAGVTGKPQVQHVGMAAPDIVVLMIRAQSVEHGRQVPYEPQAGDEIVAWRQHRYLRREGERIGSLVGPEGRILHLADRLLGDPLDIASAERPASYRVISTSGDDSAVPEAVFRKSKPVDCTRAPAEETFAMEHTVFLKLANPLTTGKSYAIRFQQGFLADEEVAFEFNPSRLRSEAIHANQIGFRPDDPVKRAFLSCWMGSGEGLSYPAGMPFQVLDANSGETVFSGQAGLAKLRADQSNKTKADIHELDFSELNKPGTYRIRVDGVGCSFPFEIGPNVWQQAFVKSMRGLYCQRSGIELGPPYTSFVRPRGFHPADGLKVYVSEPRSEGEDPAIRKLPPELAVLVASFEPEARFQRWVDDLTSKVVPNAWGGYMDAGDWDRRPDHALMPLMMFDLAEMYPDTFKHWTHDIPESSDELPDLINEALWEVDFLKRMQQADGSVYGGIESASHPRRGEASWQESLPVFAYSKSRSSAYHLAAVAARAALWFVEQGMAAQSQPYREPASKAFAWAEQQPQEQRDGDRGGSARCLAAAELYRLTGEDRYHAIFLATTRFSQPGASFYTSPMGPNGDGQGEAGWTYLRTVHPTVRKDIQQEIREAMLRDAERMVLDCESTDFCWAGGTRRPIRWGAMSMPESHVLCRAHFTTGEGKYLRAIVLSTLSGAGANPLNLCFVTGVGVRWPQHPLHEDAYVTGQPLYEGVTLGGPLDPMSPDKHPNAARIERLLYPPATQWPATEAYFDTFVYVPMCEFTVHQTMLPTSFVWGYLAARK